MSRRHSTPWRDRLPGRKPEPHFTWRGVQVSRLEALSDVVFGFALTLLVVAIEVPHTFAELMRVLRDFPAFVACFALLMVFWNAHYRFFRRYGLEDMLTRIVNYVILLLVLFSVYPLKFLFSSWIGSSPTAPFDNVEQLFIVYRIYGAGFAGIWLLFAVLQVHALRLRQRLQLGAKEIVLTRLELSGFLMHIFVCQLSICLSYLPVHPVLPGLIYGVIAPLMAFNGWWHGRAVDALARTGRPLAA